MTPSRPAAWVGPLAFATCAIAWLSLEPWRPSLEGDEWGYFESIYLTAIQRTPVVSGWLNPATVGLSVPAALLTGVVRNPWLAGALVVGGFGALALLGLWRLLGWISLEPCGRARAIVALAVFPVFLQGFTRLGSAVPAFGLMALALALLLPTLRSRSNGLLPLLAASACAAWAITIRQNHVVLAAVGLWAIVWWSPREERTLRLVAWCALPLAAIAALRYGVAPSFAQREVVAFHVSQLLASPREYAANLIRGLVFSCGCATVLALLIDPVLAARSFRRTPRAWWALGLGIAAALAATSRLDNGAWWWWWLLPGTNSPLFREHRWILAAVVVVGAVSAGSYLFELARRGIAAIEGVFVTGAAAYLAAAAVWGYFDYYFLEATLLLCLFRLHPMAAAEPGDDATGRHTGAWARAASVAVCVLAGCSWYLQRCDNDQATARLRIAEETFRQGVASPASIVGAPFGLIAWNLFSRHVEEWSRERAGHPLAFWERRYGDDPPTHLRLRCDPARPGRRILRAGTYRAGLTRVCWSLVGDDGAPDAGFPRVPHRFLPLNSREWLEAETAARSR